jgi:hypothetical protein
MTETLTALEVNCETGEQTIRPLTAEEIANGQKMAEEWAKRKAKEEAEMLAKEEARASAIIKLSALGLTEDEAKAIAG